MREGGGNLEFLDLILTDRAMEYIVSGDTEGFIFSHGTFG